MKNVILYALLIVFGVIVFRSRFCHSGVRIDVSRVRRRADRERITRYNKWRESTIAF